MIEERLQKAKILVEALPYIRAFTDKLVVIKFGGSVMYSDQLKESFAKDIVLLRYMGIRPIVIHGGGKEISSWMKKLGKESVFIDGLRVTDQDTMEITEMVLSGKINGELVSLINRHGGKAVGLSGKDADTFQARKMASAAEKGLGAVGEIANVDATIIRTLSQAGYIPIISSVGIDEAGNTLNLNADIVASAIAAKLTTEKLIFLTDIDGIMIDKRLQAKLSKKDASSLLSSPQITGGMIPKLQHSLQALDGGVNSIHIINGATEHAVLLEILTDRGIGTMIS